MSLTRVSIVSMTLLYPLVQVFPGTAVGGLILPLILPSLLQKYGSSTTLRGLALVELIALCLSMAFVKGRLPEARVHGPAARSPASRTWLKDRVLMIVVVANTLQGLAFFVPVLWLPSECSCISSAC